METNTALKVKNILVVDDTAEYREALTMFIERTLREHPVLVISAVNGADALHIIKDRHQVDPIDLIVSDVEMPVLDGVGLARVLKESGFDIPIIFNSGLSTPEAVSRLAPYSPHFIAKPGSPAVYAEKIKELLGL